MSDWPNHRSIELSGSDYNGLLEQIAEAERERDEAKDRIRQLEESVRWLDCEADRLQQAGLIACVERDEARLSITKLVEMVERGVTERDQALRDRDEARKELRDRPWRDSSIEERSAYIRERDQARKQLIEANTYWEKRCDMFEDQRDEARQQLAVCDACCKERIRERDEARAQRDQHVARILEVCRERDEARDDYERLKQFWEQALRERDDLKVFARGLQEGADSLRCERDQALLSITELTEMVERGVAERDEAQAAAREVIEHARTSYACHETIERWQDRWSWLHSEEKK